MFLYKCVEIYVPIFIRCCFCIPRIKRSIILTLREHKLPYSNYIFLNTVLHHLSFLIKLHKAPISFVVSSLHSYLIICYTINDKIRISCKIWNELVSYKYKSILLLFFEDIFQWIEFPTVQREIDLFNMYLSTAAEWFFLCKTKMMCP